MKIRKIFSSLLISVILLTLTACGSNQPAGRYTLYSPRQIAENIIAEQLSIAPMNYLEPDGEFFWDYITTRYQIDINEIEILDGIIFYAGGVIVDEIAVLLLANGADAPAVRDLLLAYADRRRIAFSGYAPVQAGILSNAVVSINGNHVALLISKDPRGAETTFLECFSDTPPIIDEYSPQQEIPSVEPEFEPELYEATKEDEPVSPEPTLPEEPEVEIITYEPAPVETVDNDAYDRRTVLLAWKTGDTSALTPMNRRVFDKCTYVINSVITDGMTGFDKQLAIINWIIMWAVYDPEFLSNSPTAQPDPNNDNPYGVLFSRVGNCFGFTYTFQLFMELLGIESIVVHGYDFTGGRHAWNLVYLYGRWYAVDVTLDVTLNNPLGVDVSHQPENIIHRHLNVTSEHLWNNLGHYWDWWSVPIAEPIDG